MNRHWYIRGICKVAGLHKRAFWSFDDPTEEQQQPGYQDQSTSTYPGRVALSSYFTPTGATYPNTNMRPKPQSYGYGVYQGQKSTGNPVSSPGNMPHIKAPGPAESEKLDQQSPYIRATTFEQHTDAKAAGRGVIMYDNDVANVRKAAEDRLKQIQNSLSSANDGQIKQWLQQQRAQILRNMAALGRSGAQVREAKANGSDAKARQNYARLTQKANDSIRPKKQKPTMPTAPAQAQAQPTAATDTAPTPAPVQPGVKPAAPSTAAQPQNAVTQPVAATGTSTGQPVTGTVPPQTTGAPTSAAPKQHQQKPGGTARNSIFKTYDTTKATGHASYTRNGITYLKYSNAAQAQAALGTNNVMAFTAKDGSRYWAPVSAKGNKPVGSYASTPGTVNNTLPKSPNIMVPSGMPGNKNGWKSAT